MARMREIGRRQGPDRMPVLQEAFRQQVRLETAAKPDRPVFIGGKSMGGRVAEPRITAAALAHLLLCSRDLLQNLLIDTARRPRRIER